MTVQEMYDEAMTARHRILVGKRAVTISSTGGKSVTYDATNLAALESYIVGLRRQLGLPTGVSAPLYPYFGL